MKTIVTYRNGIEGEVWIQLHDGRFVTDVIGGNGFRCMVHEKDGRYFRGVNGWLVHLTEWDVVKKHKGDK